MLHCSGVHPSGDNEGHMPHGWRMKDVLHQVSSKGNSTQGLKDPPASPTSGAVRGIFQRAPKRPLAHAVVEDSESQCMWHDTL